jgi:ribosomal protein L7/L12
MDKIPYYFNYIPLILLIVVIILTSLSTKIQNVFSETKNVNKKLDIILNHLNIDIKKVEKEIHHENLDKVLKLALMEKKLEAIKLYRMTTGCDLRESKTYVENLILKNNKL